MNESEKFYQFTPQKDITTSEVAEVLRSMQISLRGDLVMTHMLRHFTEVQPAAFPVDTEGKAGA